MSPKASLAAYGALAAVCLFWGTTYLAIRMSLESVPPAMLMSLRFFLSGAILLVFAKLQGAHLPAGRELRVAVISGILTVGVGTGGLIFAEQTVPSGLASLIITIQPFWLVIFEAVLPGGVPLHAPTILGMIVGFAGTVLLFLPGTSAGAFNPALLGGVLILQVSVIGWCLGSIVQKRQKTRAHPIVSGAVQQLAASLAFIPLAVFLPHRSLPLKARAIWAVAYLVVFGSIVGYSAYAYAIAKLPVAIVSIYPYVNAIVAVTLGWVFYREHFGARELLAMLVIFAGVGIVKWQTGRVQRKTAEA